MYADKTISSNANTDTFLPERRNRSLHFVSETDLMLVCQGNT